MLKTYLVQNVRIIDDKSDFIGHVLIQKNQIVQVSKELIIEKNAQIINGTNKILFPGCFDPHVHFRDPGLTHKEDFSTGSRAAISAGITSVFDMPNTKPPVFTVENLEQKRKIVQSKSVCHYGLFFGAGIGNLEEIEKVKNVPGVKLYLNSTTGNLRMDDEASWRKILHLGKKIALHAEGETFFRIVEIWEEEGFPCEIHLCHASLASEIELVRKMKKIPEARSKISVEVCPHHLFLTHKDREKKGAFCCMKPKLETEADLKALWKGVEDGTIDFFATDHAPHTYEEKEKSNQTGQSPIYGIPGVETFLPLLFTEFQKREYSLSKLAKMTSDATQKNYHVLDQKGRIKTGFDADLVLINPHSKTQVKASKFFGKTKWTPFEGKELLCKIEKTFVSGVLVFDNGEFLKNSFRGTELQFKN